MSSPAATHENPRSTVSSHASDSKTTASGVELAKSYTPATAEPVVSEKWDKSRAFHADPSAPGEPYCILIPPPNVTAALHLGHAFNNTLQDVLTRYHRMRGYKTLWMPGTDHAGIATQAVVERRLMQQGKKRTDFTREEFVAKVQAWKDEYEATIIEQLKAMGCSCDFDRTRFTMDEVCAKAVREAFFRLFKDGLIYRGKRLVNWDPVTQTALADDEVEMEEVQGHMWNLRYPLADGSGHVTVATTRPETMLGDTAVAMHPKDPRAAQFVGKQIKLPIVGREIPIIADDYVVRPPQFGGDPNDPKASLSTGFLKVTPAHDPNDEQIWMRHRDKIPHGQINIFAPDATISDKHGWTDISDEARAFIGLTREAAQMKVVEWFKLHGLLEAAKPYTHSVGHSYRSHVPIEPYLSDQWYVKVTDDRMRGEALRAMTPEQFEGKKPSRLASGAPTAHEGDGELRFFPARYAKTFQSWHENLRDWCISRQLWWGHQIPVWHKRVHLTEQNWTEHLLQWGWDDFVEGNWRDDGIDVKVVRVIDGFGVDPKIDPLMPVVAETEGEYDIYICALQDDQNRNFESEGFKRDPDVLDTWFSSGLWPISTMGWPAPEDFPNEIPEGSSLLETFNPSSVLLTAREIITLWVSRMVMFNRYFREGKLPFRNVYVHAMIQDGHGQKMSKSLGNGVDPRDIIHSHGSDALRFVMTKLATATQDVRLPVDMICPHCSETFHPKEITSPAGYKVAAPEQVCPKCNRKMISGYGAASGLAHPTKDMPLARNSSSQFDLGRNFATKLWNVTKFALSNFSDNAVELPCHGVEAHTLVDKWIISRLHRTLHTVEDALVDYQFNAYADAMYDFIWRDFCDWYIEAIKPTIKTNAAQQQVLRTVLNATLRLLHPIMPFVTETLWPSVTACGAAGLDGIKLPPHDVLAQAAWPDIKCSVEDKSAVTTFERIQTLVESIRQIRAQNKVKDKQQIRLFAPPQVLDLMKQAGGVVEALAKLKSVDPIEGLKPKGAIPFAFEGAELLVSELVDAVNVDAEKARLTKVIAEKDRAALGYRNKLNNEGYVSKAPPEKVEETRALLKQAEADRDAATNALQSLE
jgi:valyl-tRNA synthetase